MVAVRPGRRPPQRPATPEQLLWVCALRSPTGVVVAGITSARLRGLRHPSPARPELLVPAAGPLPHLSAADVRRTRLLDERDVHPTAQPPQLRLPRAVVDAASRQDRPDDVRALLLRTLDDVEAGAHSVRELQFFRLVRRGGLPPPDLQVIRTRPGGRHYLDAH